jgi:predicted ATP-dependent endonuclease of OLD family
MQIRFVEIQNYRKLKAVRIDFSDETTLLVGANNSGKTSAMIALSRFLITQRRFSTNDFTLTNWAPINKIGEDWESQTSSEDGKGPTISEWEPYLPSLDLWLEVEADEIHYVRHILPFLDWEGGLIGVRLRLEPEIIDDLCKEFLRDANAAKTTKAEGKKISGKDKEYKLALWPRNMRDFLDRRLNTHFTVRCYLLDPAKYQDPQKGIAAPQALPDDSQPIKGNPLSNLIKINEIAAQRGLGDSGVKSGSDGQQYSSREIQKLSEQLRSYYSKHLDPTKSPVAADLDALEAIEDAQKIFDERLDTAFATAIKELESLNYPGVTDPKLRIATRMQPTDGLNHDTAVQYEIFSEDGGQNTSLRLPEEYNGLGYQNLISMVFKLMSFRDEWMMVGKAKKTETDDKSDVDFPPPLHLVLVEEPEAHLHAQVQQVFVRKAFEVLRNHAELKSNKTFRTQLIVSTHSSHVAHETTFSCLRYFRRLPASAAVPIPQSAVINLSSVFGTSGDTEKFVTRYLKATHCDLFFADAAILVEGSAEKILVPHFIRSHFPKLNGCYVTLLEIGGRHAHRLRPLIESLGLTTLIVTDIDSVSPSGHHKAAEPKLGCKLESGNATLSTWHPKEKLFDKLLALSDDKKIKKDYDIPLFSVRVAYQCLIKVSFKKEEAEIPTTTFEDSLVFENLALFKSLDEEGMIKSFGTAIQKSKNIDELTKSIFAVVKKVEKAAFALELLTLQDPADLAVPSYIRSGLQWLQDQLVCKEQEVLATATEQVEDGDCE